MKFFPLAALLFCPLLATAQLAVTVSAPKVVGQKAVVQLKMKNQLAAKVESARAVCFLLDDQGKIAGQSTKWVIGQNHASLEPKAEAAFNFVITSPQPWTTTNLAAKISFSRVDPEGMCLETGYNFSGGALKGFSQGFFGVDVSGPANSTEYNGQQFGRSSAEALSIWLAAKGTIDTGTGLTVMGGSLTLEAGSGGLATIVAGLGLVAGAVDTGTGLLEGGVGAIGLYNYNKLTPLERPLQNGGGTSQVGIEDAPENKPYSDPANRPSYENGQVDQVWENGKQPDGNVYDPNTGELLNWDKSKPRTGQWDMGHMPGQEYRKLWQDYMDGRISKDEFLQRYRDPQNYQPEAPSANRSRQYEQK